jgi:amino acid transporter
MAYVAVLGIFALLVLLGISDSANVAAVMFVGHMSVMTTLLVWCIVYVIRDPSMFNGTLRRAVLAQGL